MITINLLDPNDSISNGPTVINAAFTVIKAHIDAIETIINTNQSTIKLTNTSTIPQGSIECATIVLSQATGIVLSVSPNGAAATATINADGTVSCLRVIATGLVANNQGSSFGDLAVTNNLAVTGAAALSGLVDLTGANSRVVEKTEVIAVASTNIGGSATSPIEISKKKTIYFDYSNSGSSLGNGDVKLDLSNVLPGQLFRIVCLAANISGAMSLNNGTTGSELFAYFNSNDGFHVIDASVKPTFNPGPGAGTTKSWMICQYMDIGGGNNKLVILESENMTNVG